MGQSGAWDSEEVGGHSGEKGGHHFVEGSCEKGGLEKGRTKNYLRSLDFILKLQVLFIFFKCRGDKFSILFPSLFNPI